MINRKLCPRCKTGKKTYELDKRSGECPYLGRHDGKKCPMFVKMEKAQTEGLLKRIFTGGMLKYNQNKKLDKN